MSGISYGQQGKYPFRMINKQPNNFVPRPGGTFTFKRLEPGFVITEDVVNKCRDVVTPDVSNKLNKPGKPDGTPEQIECHWILGVDPSLIPLKLTYRGAHSLILRKDGSLIPYNVRKLCTDQDYYFKSNGEVKNWDCSYIHIQQQFTGTKYDEEKAKDPDFYKGEYWIRHTMNDPPDFLEAHAAKIGKRFGEPGFVIDKDVVAYCKKCGVGICSSLDYDEDFIDTGHTARGHPRAKCDWISGTRAQDPGRINYQGDGSLAKPNLPFTLVSRVVKRPNTENPNQPGFITRGRYISHTISELCKDDTLMPSQKRTKSDCDLIANPPDLGPLLPIDPVAGARLAKEKAQQNVTIAEKELTKLKATLLKAEQKLADAKTALAEAEKALKDAIDAQSKQLIVFQDNLKAAETKFQKAQEEFETVNQELQKLKEQLTSVETKAKTADTAKALAEKAVLEAKNKLSQFQGNGPVTAQAAPQESNSGTATQTDSSVTAQAASQESNSDAATQAESSQPAAGDANQASPPAAN